MRVSFKSIQLFALVLLLFLPKVGFAFTDKQVNARTPATLEKSLNEMLADLSLKEQIAFMTAFFRVAYESNPAKVPYAQAQSLLLVSRMRPAKYPDESANSYIADGRMDSMDPISGYTVWKVDGWSKNESYVRFILNFGDSIDGLSGHQIMGTSSRVSASQANAEFQENLKRLEDLRTQYIGDLQKAEAQYGACKSFHQDALRTNIKNVEAAISAARAGGKLDFRATGSYGLSSRSCRGRAAAAPYQGAPVNSDIKNMQQQAQSQALQRDTLYTSSVNRMSVTRTHTLKFTSRSSTQAQLEVLLDVSEPRSPGKTFKRVNFHVIAFPKNGGDPIYFRGRLPALGQSEVSASNLTLFATVLRPGSLSDKKSAYRFGVVVNRIAYDDGTTETLASDMRDFKDWVKTQQLVTQ